MFKYTQIQIIGIGLLCVLSTTNAQAVSVGGCVRAGNEGYAQGDFKTAIEHYEQALIQEPESPLLHFNKGAALYQDGQSLEAIHHFHKALLTENKELQQKAHFNLGNALYQEGLRHVPEEIEAAIHLLEKALTQYTESLGLNPDDQDVQHNQAFVQQEIERLKLMQQQQQKQSSSEEGKGEESESQEPSAESKDAQGSSEDDASANSNEEESDQPPEEESTKNMDAQDSSSSKEDSSGQSSEDEANASEDKAASQAGEDAQDASQKNQEASAGEQDENASKQPLEGLMQGLTQQEAEQLLHSYEQTEQPRGLLNVFQRQGQERPVLQDW